MSTKLYVGNLPYETTESDLQALFEGAGQVAGINIVRDRATGRARGFAFVEMGDAEAARRAITELDQHSYGGRNLMVNEARPMEPRGNGNGGGFGGSQAPRVALVSSRRSLPDSPDLFGDPGCFSFAPPQPLQWFAAAHPSRSISACTSSRI